MNSILLSEKLLLLQNEVQNFFSYVLSARNFHIGFDPDNESHLKIRDPSLTRLPTIGSFSLL